MSFNKSTNMSTSTQQGMNHSMNDPVTRAVVDNIMGNLPTKRPQVRCHDCDLDFTSQVVLDAHLQGARHAKQMRSKNILASLEETNVAFSKDQETNGLKCNVCNVQLNSIQQLQTHLNGNRHKKKMSKGDWTGKEIVSRSDVIGMSANYITQPLMKTNLLSCTPCNKFFNSESQLNVHLSSQKHADKVDNTKGIKKKRFFPYWKNKGNNKGTASQKPLTNNFIPGGYETYA